MRCYYNKLRQQKKKIFFCFIILVLLAVLGITSIKVDVSGVVFIPDADENFRIAAKLLSQAPGASILFVDVEGENAAEAAATIEKAVPADIAVTIQKDIADISSSSILRGIPFFFDADMEKRMNELLNPGKIAEAMAENRKALQGFQAIAGMDWIRGDPLNFRSLLLERIPATVHSLNNESPDGKDFLLLFKPLGSSFDAESAQKLVSAILGAVPTGHKVHISGSPAHTAANSEVIQNDLFRIVGLSLAGFALAYILLARSWGAVWILFTAALSTCVGVAMTGILWPVASGVAIGFGASLMGLAEDYAVHMHFGLRSDDDQEYVYCYLCNPLFQSFLLNCSGFVILLFSVIPAIRQTGAFAIASLATGFFLAIFVLPFIPGFSKPRNINPVLAHQGNVPSIKRSAIVCLVLAISCAAFYGGLSFNYSPRSLGSDSERIEAARDRIRRIWPIENSENIIIEGESRDDALRKSSRIANKLRAFGAKNVLAPSDFMLPDSQAVANIARWNEWLDLAALRQKIDMAAKKEGFGLNAFAPFYEALLSSPRMPKIPSDLLLFDKYAIISIESVPEEIISESDDGVYVFSPSLLEKRMEISIQSEKRLMTLGALVIFLVLASLLRDPPRILAVMVPPLFTVAIIFFTFLILNKSVTLAALAAMPIVFGLSLDHGIMITHALGGGHGFGVRRAVVLASVTAFFSIGLLALSSHPALSTMGLVIFTGLASELVASLWIVPNLYVKKQIGHSV